MENNVQVMKRIISDLENNFQPKKEREGVFVVGSNRAEDEPNKQRSHIAVMGDKGAIVYSICDGMINSSDFENIIKEAVAMFESHKKNSNNYNVLKSARDTIKGGFKETYNESVLLLGESEGSRIGIVRGSALSVAQNLGRMAGEDKSFKRALLVAAAGIKVSEKAIKGDYGAFEDFIKSMEKESSDIANKLNKEED